MWLISVPMNSSTIAQSAPNKRVSTIAGIQIVSATMESCPEQSRADTRRDGLRENWVLVVVGVFQKGISLQTSYFHLHTNAQTLM